MSIKTLGQMIIRKIIKTVATMPVYTRIYTERLLLYHFYTT